MFTEPTREADRFFLPHRLAPTAGSLCHPGKARFPSMSLRYVWMSLNHKRFRLSTDTLSSIFLERMDEIVESVENASFGEKHLTFQHGHGKVLPIRKRLRRRRSGIVGFQRAAVRWKAAACIHKTHHFRAGNPKAKASRRFP